MIGNFTRNMNLESEIQKTWILKFYIKYLTNSKCFSDFCKNFQGKFFFKGQHQFSTIKCTYLYKPLLAGIFLNPYPIKAHCADSNPSLETQIPDSRPKSQPWAQIPASKPKSHP